LKSKEKKPNLKIILVEPNGPINVGSIARLCANFKVDQLRIVSPRCDIYSIEAKKMALRGISYIDDSRIFENISDAIADCDLVLASCGRSDINTEFRKVPLENISQWIRKFKNLNNVAIIFGREDRGLTNKELLMAHKVFNIPTNINYQSLNLSHAVSIVLYEFNKDTSYKQNNEKLNFDIANSKEIEESFSDIEKLLLKAGYLQPHTANAKISKFKKFILKAQTTSHEINVLRGIVNQINWAIKNIRE
tara:strand:- start:2739 stop:3485 length:747 start_codon:yes stop_codon:yes gene_type:complete